MDYSNLVSVVSTLSALIEKQKATIEAIEDESHANYEAYVKSQDKCRELEDKLTQAKYDVGCVNPNLEKNNTVLIDIATKLLLARGRNNCQRQREGMSALHDDTSYVGAVKAVRIATAWVLKDAKDFVEAFQWPGFEAKKEEPVNHTEMWQELGR